MSGKLKVFTVVTEKGGVGKTSIAVTIGCGLSARGYSVLLLDTDEQGHVAESLGFAKSPALFNLLQRNAPWGEVLLQVEPEQFMPPGSAVMNAGRLLISPSNIETRVLPMLVRPEAGLLARRLQQLEGNIDFVIVDTGPAAGLMHLLVYAASDYVLFPTKLEYLSFDGLKEARGHVQDANGYRQANGLPPIQEAGVIPTMYRSSTLEHNGNLAFLKEAYGDLVWSPIGESTLWSESLAPTSGHRPVYAYAHGSKAAEEALALIDRVIRLGEAQ